MEYERNDEKRGLRERKNEKGREKGRGKKPTNETQ